MNSFLKTIGLIISIVGCIATTMVWINIPVVGEIKGISNPSGIIALGGFIFCALLYFISLMSEERGIYWFLLILSTVPLISGFYYYQNIQTVIEQLTNLSKISIFGMSVGDYYDASNVIEWKNGFRITMLSGGINLFFAFVLIVSEDPKQQSKTISRTLVSNQSQTTLKLEAVSNFDNEPYIQKLKELFELNNAGVIPNNLYEDEKQKITEQQKIDKIKFDEQIKEEITKQNPKVSDRRSYIFKPTPHKKTIDPNVVFVVVACLLLIGFATYSLTSNKNKSQNNELPKASEDSIGLVTNKENKVQKELKSTIFPKHKFESEVEKQYIHHKRDLRRDFAIDSEETVKADLNNDGQDEIVKYYTLANKDGGCMYVGRGIIIYENTKIGVIESKYEPSYAFEFTGVVNGKINVSKLDFGENDMCYPTIPTIGILNFKNHQLFFE